MSTQDWTMVRGLTGKGVDDRLYALAERYDMKLAKDQEALLAICSEAAMQKAALYHSVESTTTDTALVEGSISSGELVLQEKTEALERAVHLREVFRVRHGLLCEPEIPVVFLSILMFGLMIFGEAFINAMFLQNAHLTASPTSALLTSVLISGANILTSACAGHFFGRYLRIGANASDGDASEFRWSRAKGFFGILVYLVGISFFHLTVGLVRSQETLTEVSHSLSAYRELVTTPEALFLVMTGLCLSMMAYHKGKSAFDDSYPGYGNCQRNVEAREEDLLDAKEELGDEVEGLFKDAQRKAEEAEQSQLGAVNDYNSSVEKSHSAHRNLTKLVHTSKIQLKTEIAGELQSYAVGSGKKSGKTVEDYGHLISFEHYLEVVLPEALPLPDYSEARGQLRTAKALALDRLGELFSNDDPDNEGEET